jgi:hypothetical protein
MEFVAVLRPTHNGTLSLTDCRRTISGRLRNRAECCRDNYTGRDRVSAVCYCVSAV